MSALPPIRLVSLKEPSRSTSLGMRPDCVMLAVNTLLISLWRPLQVDCVASGLPDPEVSWSLPDGTLVNNALQSDDSGTRQRRYIIFTNGTLLLHQIDKKDEGDYTCTAKNKLGTDERKVSVKVGPNAPQIKSKSQSLVVVRLGDSAKLSCEAIAEPAPRIMWISPRNPALSDKYEILNNGMLVIKKVGLSDEGKYVCVARNSAGDDTKNVKVEIEQQAPSINGQKGKSYGKVMAVNYQTTLLDCKVESKPEPRIWWVTPYAQSFAVGYLGGRFQVHRNGSLELRGVRKNDEGRYSCFAKNLLGESTLTVEVEVASIAEKPSFAFPSIEIIPIKEDGGKVLLECPARGKPNPEFAWFHHYSNNGSLRISQPVQSDKGVYRCLAKNVAGQAEKRYSSKWWVFD
uniref:Ig-like domain-containing protein n=1 Tax=Periophthalmus magnuspinnatus TaxID=409849 RepID=A0A3B4AIP4_9GOBI